MAEEIKTEAPQVAEAQEVDAATPAANPETTNPEPNLDGFLADFDATVPPDKNETQKNDDPLRLNEPLTQEHAILDYLSAIEQERQITRDKADFELVVQEASKAVADAENLPKDYARLRMEQWAKNEYATNEEFRQAWDNRHMTGEAARLVTNTVNKAIGNLQKEVAAMPPPIDPEATADRAAVSAAVRAGSGKPPEDRPPDYANMTDRDFEAEKAKLGV
jgi:hypothetical protein